MTPSRTILLPAIFHALVLAGVATALVPGACGQAPTDKAAFLALYDPAMQRLLGVYGNAQVEATYEKSAFRNAPDEKHVLRIATRDPRVRLERAYVSGKRSGEATTSVASPEVSFRVTRGAEGTNTLDDLSSDFKGASERVRLFGRAVSAPFSIFELTIGDFLRQPSVALTSLKEVNEGGRRLVALEFDQDMRFAGFDAHRIGQLTFDADRSYALIRYAMHGTDSPDKQQVCAAMEYDGAIDGVPVLKSAEYYYLGPQGKSNVERYDVTRFDPTPPPASDFTLQAFGLPDVQGPTPGPGRYTILLVGLALLALGVVLRLWIARR